MDGILRRGAAGEDFLEEWGAELEKSAEGDDQIVCASRTSKTSAHP